MLSEMTLDQRFVRLAIDGGETRSVLQTLVERRGERDLCVLVIVIDDELELR